MPVGSATRHEAEEICERRDSFYVFANVTGMPYLDSIEAHVDERLEPFAPTVRPGMRPHSDRARRVRESDCFANFEALLLNETRSSCSKEAIERFARVAYVSAANQRARNMRATNRSARRFFHHCIQLDVHSEPAKSLDNVLRANFTRVAKRRQLRLENVAPRYVQREQMNLASTIVRTKLGTSDDSNPEWLSGQLCFTQSAECVVVGEGDRRETCLARRLDDSRGRKRAIGRSRVHVQVDLSGRPVGLPRVHHCL
jgi:hypothetical protein